MTWEVRRSGWAKGEEDARSNWDVDYGRIIHSASFRRLQGKTQILNLGDSDFYRTRLTHSLEVAQIAAGVTRQIKKDNARHEAVKFLPDLALIQAIGSTHDLGHPPFGHGGEVALNYCMRDQGGFEGNGQTLRILTRLERFSASHGADLTRRTLLGTLKYPVAYSAVNVLRPSMHHNFATRLLDRDVSKPPKCFLDSEGEIVNWILNPLSLSDRELFQKFETSGDSSANKKHGKPIYKSLDCSIMDTSDDIAYGVHDLEDVISLGLVDIEDFLELVSKEIMEDFFEFRAKFSNGLRKGGAYEEFVRAIFSGGNERKHMISRLVYYFVSNCVIVTRGEFHEPLLKFSILLKPQAQKFVDSLKNLVRSKVIYSPSVQHLEFKGQQMVIAVFEVLASDPKSFLPKENYDIYERNKACKRVICDYVAGMTDKFLLRTYERLFSPRMGSVFDKL